MIFCGALLSCQADITLSLSDSGDSLLVDFSGQCGPAFTEMILAASEPGQEIFDTNEISRQLKASAFSDVKVNAKGSKISLSLKDQDCKSYLFTSGLLSLSEDKKIHVNINQQKLKAFYDSADEEIRLLLDLFLAPVFNDESMTAEEYVPMIGTIYGQEAEKEIAESHIIFNGKKTLKLADLLCGQESKW